MADLGFVSYLNVCIIDCYFPVYDYEAALKLYCIKRYKNEVDLL